MTIAQISQKATHFSVDDLAMLEHVPQHVAIIMDGNRRWARRQTLRKINPLSGHWQGAETLSIITEAASEIGIQELTVYAFSTENWKRSPEEVKTLMGILVDYLKKERSKMIDEGVCFRVLGNLKPFSKEVREEIQKTVKATRRGQKLGLNVALNYGGRDEMRRAIQAIAHDVKQEKVSVKQISEELIGRYLDTGHLSDPELLIRTSGEMRLSNFLLWQIAYSEVYVTDVLWPDFAPQDLLDALLHYQERERRIGK